MKQLIGAAGAVKIGSSARLEMKVSAPCAIDLPITRGAAQCGESAARVAIGSFVIVSVLPQIDTLSRFEKCKHISFGEPEIPAGLDRFFPADQARVLPRAENLDRRQFSRNKLLRRGPPKESSPTREKKPAA